MFRRAPILVAVLVAIALPSTVRFSVSRAAFTGSTASSSNSFGTDSLDPPSAVDAAMDGNDVVLDWTVTPDLYASGYEIWRGTSPGCCYALHDTVSGQSSTTYTDVGALSGSAPVFESVATAIQGPGSGTSVTVSRPTGTVDGDLLVAVVGIDNSSGTAPINPPAGWTEIFHDPDSGTGGNILGAWYRVAASEPATYQFTWSNAEEASAAVLRYSGVDQTDPIDVSSFTPMTASSTPTAPSVTTTVDDTRVLRVVGLDNNDHVEPSPLTGVHPGGTTGRFELLTSPDPDSGGVIGAGADELQASAGSTGTAVFSTTGSEQWVAATIAFKPEQQGPFYYVARSEAMSWFSSDSNETRCCVPVEAGSWATTALGHTPGAGTDRLLVFIAATENATDRDLTAVSFGGQALTQGPETSICTAVCARTEMWYLGEAGIAAAVHEDFAVTWGGSPSGLEEHYSAVTLEGIDQTTPLGPTSTNTSTSDPIQLAAGVAVDPGDVVVVAAMSGNGGSYTPDADYSEGIDSSGSTSALATAHKIVAVAGTEQPSMDFDGTVYRQAIIGAVINGGGASDLLVPSYDNDRTIRYESGNPTTNTTLELGHGLDEPYGMSVAPSGDFYVSSHGTDEVIRYDGNNDHVSDFATGAIPIGQAFGPDGNLYVAEWTNDEVRHYDPDTGTDLGAFVTSGSGGLDGPTGITFGPYGHLYVSGFNDSAVYKYNGSTGASMGTFVTAGSGGLSLPEDLTFGPDGHLYVADVNDNDVKKYNGTTGASLGVFTSGQSINGATGIAFGPDGYLYASEFWDNTVLRFDDSTGVYYDTYISAGLGGLDGPTYLRFAGSRLVSAWSDLALTYAAPAGTDRLLVFVASVENATDRDLTSVIYGRQVMTEADGAVVCTTFCARTEIWYLNDAGITAAATNELSVTWAGGAQSETEEHYGVVVLENVDQAAPLGATSTANGTGNPIQVAAPIAVRGGDMVVVAAVAGNPGSYTPDASYTEGLDFSLYSATTATATKAIGFIGTEQPSMTFDATLNRHAIVGATFRMN